MERYSTNQGMEAMPVDPVAEWAAPGGETGLEGHMRQLDIGGGPESYPKRPDEPNCIYYLRTGLCGYGNRCRYNHPRDRSAAMGALRASGGEYPERVGQPVCQYYIRMGMCKFGASCKYHHPKHGVGSSALVSLNLFGYPLRPGEKECSYYIKTGQCKFSLTCKFHHPQPAGMQVPTAPLAPAPAPMPLAPPTSVPSPTPAYYPTVQSPSVQSPQQYGFVPGNLPIARPAMLPGSYVPGSYGPVLLAPGVVPVPGWTPYQAQVGPAAMPSSQQSVGAGQVYGITHLPPSSTAYTGPYLSSAAGPSSSSQKEIALPERPSQPVCQYYLRTGDCKFGSTCKYHHLQEWRIQNTTFLFSPMGLPLRQGAPLCSHYAQNGVCKFGPLCKFDHPMRALSYSSSSSSLTDMPVAPYPVGSTNTTLAFSSPSSDLRPELLSGFSNDTFSSASVGSSVSKGGSNHQFSVQPSGQDSSSSTGGSGSSHGGEARQEN